jgi:hypothetical protein
MDIATRLCIMVRAFLALLFVSLVRLPAQAGAIIYTNRTAWENAMITAGAGPLTHETFDQNIANDVKITFSSGVISEGFLGNL